MIHRRAPSVLFALISLCGVAYLASATIGPSDPRVFPYTGHLETGPDAATGLYDFRFALFGAAPGDTGCLVDNSCVALWSEQIDGVSVSVGRFSVKLGEGSAIPDDPVMKSDELWLGIAVREQGTTDFSPLAGAQEILATPWAARAAAAKDYKVSGALEVGGQVSSGSLSTGEVTATSVSAPTVSATTVGATSVTTGSLVVLSGVSLPAGSVPGAALASQPIACGTWSAAVSNSGGGYRAVVATIPDGSYARTGGGCDCGSSNPGRLMVVNAPTSSNAWVCGCKDHSAGDGNNDTTAFVSGCRLH